MTVVNTGGYRANYESFSLFCLLLALVAFGVSCGGSSAPDCSVATALNILPSVATADHSAAPPGNQTQFVGFDQLVPGCPPTPGPLRTDLKWTVSDPVNVTIGNTQNVDYGLAACKNATAAAVTVTATGTNSKGATITGTSTLTCK
jgi:hypothetical protein